MEFAEDDVSEFCLLLSSSMGSVAVDGLKSGIWCVYWRKNYPQTDEKELDKEEAVVKSPVLLLSRCHSTVFFEYKYGISNRDHAILVPQPCSQSLHCGGPSISLRSAIIYLVTQILKQ